MADVVPEAPGPVELSPEDQALLDDLTEDIQALSAKIADRLPWSEGRHDACAVLGRCRAHLVAAIRHDPAAAMPPPDHT